MKILVYLLKITLFSTVTFTGLVNAQTAPADVKHIFDAPNVRRALDFINSIEADTIAEQIRVCQIPAPTFKEAKRAEYFKQRFSELGLKNVRIDGIGNVIGERPGSNRAAPVLVLAAHLDTVFPEDTELKVKRDG